MVKDGVLYRVKYINQVKPFVGKNIIKVITGQRRVGKSFLLKQIAREIVENDSGANIIFLNLEDFEFRKINTDESLYEFIEERIRTGFNNYLFIDEVQNVRGFESVLKNYVSKNTCDVFVTGSNGKMLSGDLATYLSGRYIEIPVHPLSYGEFLEIHGLINSDESLISFLHFGGLPYLKNLVLNEEIVFEYLKNVSSTVLLKDVIQHENIRNADFLQLLSVFIADNLGNIFSANNISRFLKSQNININVAQIINYIGAFENAHLVNRVKRTEVNGFKIFEVGEKIYFEDLGLRNSLVGFNFSKDIGKLMENAVYNHLSFCGFKIFVGRLGETEIDFVAEKNGKKVYVQVCYLVTEENRKREFGNLEKVADNYEKYVVSMNPLLQESNVNGIIHIHLKDFLLKKDL